MPVTIYHNPQCARRSFPTPLYLGIRSRRCSTSRIPAVVLHRQPLLALLYLRHPWRRPWSRKSRATLKLLEDRGLKPRVIEHLKTPPSAAELKKLTAMLGIAPRALLRTKEAEYKQARLDDPGLSDAQIVKAMVKYPKLIEYPIVVAGKKAALGRPPENILKIL